MKKTLLTTLLLAAIGASAQTVNTFYTINSTPASYYLASSDPALDETPAGADAQWGFINLSSDGNSSTTVLAATTAQSASYPGTTSVVETTGDFTTTQFFLANVLNGGVQVTAVSASGLLLNYNTDNLNLGTFPKAFTDDAVTDAVAGTFQGFGVSGTFTGTATTDIDAYGVISGLGGDADLPMVIFATRLKIEQNLTLYIGPLPAGTFTEVMYSYYADGAPINGPVFRTLTAHLTAPAAGIDDTTQSIESYYAPTAGIENFEKAIFRVVPNPVTDVLHFAGDAQITKVTVIDAAGRVVVQSGATNDVNVSQLSAGIYYVTAHTAQGTSMQKIVKQ